MPLLVFLPLFGLTILPVPAGAALDGQAFDPVLGIILGAVTPVGGGFAWRALREAPERAIGHPAT